MLTALPRCSETGVARDRPRPRTLFIIPVIQTHGADALNFDLTDAAPEHKAGFAAPRESYDELRQIFEDFKAANDERLAVIEHKRGDVLLEQKVDRINAALDAQQRRLDDILLRGARPGIGGSRTSRDHAAREHKSAFDAYVRAGDVEALRAFETKAMSVGSNPDGRHLVPPELERTIERLRREMTRLLQV